MSDPSLDATPTTAMRPQDQVIYILGRIEGGLSSLNQTVKDSAVAQSAVNAAHEVTHSEFRGILSAQAADIAVLKDNKESAKESRRESVQKWMTIVGVPAAILSCGAIVAYLLTAHP